MSQEEIFFSSEDLSNRLANFTNFSFSLQNPNENLTEHFRVSVSRILSKAEFCFVFNPKTRKVRQKDDIYGNLSFICISNL